MEPNTHRHKRSQNVLAQVDAGGTLEEAVRAMSDLRSLIIPLGFEEVDVRAFRTGGISGAAAAAPAALAGGVAGETSSVEGVLEKGNMGIDLYRVSGTARTTSG